MAKSSHFYGVRHTVLVEQRSGRRHLLCREPADYLEYLDCLQDSLLRCAVFLHAYCLLPNRAALLMSAGCGSAFSGVLQRLVRSRPGSCGWHCSTRRVRGEEELLQLYRYIDFQPVRNGLVGTPGAWYWGSYACNAHGVGSELLTPHETYLALGQDAAQRQQRYRQLCGWTAGESGISEPAGPVLH